MNALVISGGGSKGAFAGGVAEYLINVQKKEYDLFVGTSTGSLLIPLLARNNMEKAKKIFTNISTNDIFTICPFLIKKEGEVFKTRFNHLGIAKMFLEGQKTLGDSTKLRELIKQNFREADFNFIIKKKKEIVVTVSNLTHQEVEFKSSNDCTYKDFCDWIWASANLLPFMSLLSKEGCEYGDGGFGDLIPIQKAINLGATTIDVIVLQPAQREMNLPPIRNAFEVMTRTYDFMFRQIAKDDLMIGRLAAANKKVDIHFYFTPRLLTEQSFIFDPEQMKKWWQEGYDICQQKMPLKHSCQPLEKTTSKN